MGHQRSVPVLNPADVIVGVGYLDDATVIAFCLKLVQRELERCQEWQAAQAKPGKAVDVWQPVGLGSTFAGLAHEERRDF
ncbi:MAG: YkvA family protein [Prosthecobacter sp.]|jgi:uncharacterized membrane protein YkvA (DUF1232 family)